MIYHNIVIVLFVAAKLHIILKYASYFNYLSKRVFKKFINNTTQAKISNKPPTGVMRAMLVKSNVVSELVANP